MLKITKKQTPFFANVKNYPIFVTAKVGRPTISH